jgi:CheY-like chemotaxis protein
MYGELLAKSGLDVSFASNGEQAVALARAMRPPVILMDLSMPVMDGVEATKKLRADALTKSARVIAITGHADSPLAQQARALCDAFVMKPSTPAEVLALVRSMLDLGPRA